MKKERKKELDIVLYTNGIKVFNQRKECVFYWRKIDYKTFDVNYVICSLLRRFIDENYKFNFIESFREATEFNVGYIGNKLKGE